MRTLLIITVLMSIVGCAEMKVRLKNVNGENTQAQIDQDYKTCYEYTSNKYDFNQCVKKKGYYYESYTE